MITLTSDFPAPYPAAMKGVIAGRTDARLVDIAHDLPRQDIRTAAFWLRETLPNFPPAVHLVVVDPGVGTDRAALAVKAGEHALVGPDNGVLVPAVRALVAAEPGEAIDAHPGVEAFEIAVQDPASATFHGRDVFAPAAAEVHLAGVEGMGTLDDFDPVAGLVDLTFPEPERRSDGVETTVSATVLAVDGFGNVITNVPGEWLPMGTAIHVDVYQAEDVSDTVASDEGSSDEHLPAEGFPLARRYAAVDPGVALATVGSHGNLELAVNRGRGDDAFGVVAGDELTITWPV